jgi:hypothetical protein
MYNTEIFFQILRFVENQKGAAFEGWASPYAQANFLVQK